MSVSAVAWPLCLGLLLALSIVARRWLRVAQPRTKPLLSKDPALMRPQYDVVVIGSGYGGGVAASRMARAGKKVCVLERGTERWPGEYPQSLKAALQEYHCFNRRPGKGSSLGKESGLFQRCKGQGQDVLSGCGLGGTSLINAGVYLRPDKRVFEASEWPVEIRENTHDLERYFERGEQVFRPTPYPDTMPKPRKLSIFENQARELNVHHRFFRPPLTTQFEDRTNSVGVEMRQSTGSGNECTGINDGSKNTVLVTYLADAWTWGAEMFCGVDVKYIQRAEDGHGFLVYYELLDYSQGAKRLMWVHAKELVMLGAGALGTTEILLRSRTHGLPTSGLLGEGMSGNGDLLAFAYNTDQQVNSIGRDLSGSMPPHHCGPTISACIDMRGVDEAPNAQDGFVIQEGAVPEALSPVIQAILESKIGIVRLFTNANLEKTRARIRSWLYGPYCAKGSISRTAVYLIMSHDDNTGTMAMKDGRTILQWSGVSPTKKQLRSQNLLSKAAKSIGGTLVQVPRITVHPLGGACMSRDNTGLGGVVDHMGQVLSGPGSQVHKGIVCIDASIIPTSLGINPSATITALAERCCDLIVSTRGWHLDSRANEPLDLQGRPYRSTPSSSDQKAMEEGLRLNRLSDGLRFDETLHGFLRVTSEDSDYTASAMLAKAFSSQAKLSIRVYLHRCLQNIYEGTATGTLSYAALSGESLLITHGLVRLFTPNPKVSDAVNIVYVLKLLSKEGKTYLLHGSKTIDSDVTFSLPKTWVATTTLFTRITLQDGTQVAKGILRLSPADFVAECLSLRCSDNISFSRQLRTKMAFLSFFARNLIPYVFSPFRSLSYSKVSVDEFVQRSRSSQPFEVWIQSSHGVSICIKMWEPSTRVARKKTPIVLIPGASVNEQLFSLSTISTNAIDYFTLRGYRCYVPILRFGADNAEAKNGWTVFDARLDVRAVLGYIRDREDSRQLYVIAHCLGSIATATALLHGDVEAGWLCGITCSQVFTDLIYSQDNDFKARNPWLIRLYKAIAGEWFSCRSSPSAPWLQILLDQILRLYPTGSMKEMCNSAICHRCNLPFGRCWTHANLNRATHAQLGEIFDGIHMNFLAHLSGMGVAPDNHVRTNWPDFKDLVPENLHRLAGLKICFLSGSENAVWQPAATKVSFDLFRHTFPEGRYKRVVVQGYGHMDCWIGSNAYRDVYPKIAHHINTCEEVS